MVKLNFSDLNLSKEILSAVKDLGFEQASEIQSQAIPYLMDGNDLIGQSHTGSGKTAAFGIPCIEKIDTSNKNTQALIMCPTRELSVQVAAELTKLLKYKKNINIVAIYGGQSIGIQLRSLSKGAQIVIGTPGRIMDHLERKSISLQNINTVILDEADRMLDMGFRDDIELILSQTPKNRQTILFSATLPLPIKNLARKYQNNPKIVTIKDDERTVPKIDQSYYEVKSTNKLEALTRIIEVNNFKLIIIFCNTKRQVDELVSNLQLQGYFAEGLHGDMRQEVRDRVMRKFKNLSTNILIATDLAGRGIDVDNIEAVINYDIPQDLEDYVHRIGRTGRAGKSGKAITLISARDLFKLKRIERFGGIRIKNEKVPSYEDIEKIRTKAFAEKIKLTLAEGNFGKYKKIVEHLIDDKHSPIDIACAVIKTLLTKDSQENEKQDTAKSKASKKHPDEMERLFITIGRSKMVRPGDIVGAIAGECGISGQEIGEIAIFDNYTFVEIPSKYTEKVIETMKRATIKGNRINIEVAEDRAN